MTLAVKISEDRTKLIIGQINSRTDKGVLEGMDQFMYCLELFVIVTHTTQPPVSTPQVATTVETFRSLGHPFSRSGLECIL